MKNRGLCISAQIERSISNLMEMGDLQLSTLRGGHGHSDMKPMLYQCPRHRRHFGSAEVITNGGSGRDLGLIRWIVRTGVKDQRIIGVAWRDRRCTYERRCCLVQAAQSGLYATARNLVTHPGSLHRCGYNLNLRGSLEVCGDAKDCQWRYG